MLEKLSSKPGLMSFKAWRRLFDTQVAALKMSVTGLVLTPQGFGEEPGPIEVEKALSTVSHSVLAPWERKVTSASYNTLFTALVASSAPCLEGFLI